MMHSRRFRFVILTASMVMSVAVIAADPQVGPDPNEVKAMVDRAVTFLKTRQEANGSFSPQRSGPGISALVAAGLIRHGRTDDPLVQKTMRYLESAVKKDG